MEFRLLGEVELWAAGQMLDVGAPRLQAVLAALALDAGRPVAIETLIDRVWDDHPPVEARNVLYSYLSRIRRLLTQATALTAGTAVRIERRHAGYVLDIDPDQVDLHRFRRLVDEGSDSRRGDADRAAALAEALGLWRGPPLPSLPGQWAGQVRDSWYRRRLDAVVQWAQVELRLGHPTTVIATLPDLVAEYPLVEPLETLLMRALHAAGRGAEAVDRYTAIRQRLADELGADPGPELRALHQAVLQSELPLVPSDLVGAAVRTVASPAQLPPDISGFSGRGDELHRLDGLLRMAGDRSTAVVISAVSGTAGVGKTALAVHWAHRVRDEFADGQLYVNLRGFDPTGSPVTPADAVRGFLDAFEVPAERIPTRFNGQVGLYRSLLASRRVLVVLDNAHDAEQVRPLLPGASGCVVVVTSRNQLTGLVAEGAHPLQLDVLPAAEARELLVSRLGARRVAAEPHAVDEIIILCARLPLALAIVAARAATHPGFGLAVLAGELREGRGGLDEFTGTDPATDARAVFSWSYRQLSPDAARLFRLLGLHPGPDITRPAAASLACLPPAQARRWLAGLAQAHLLVEHTPGRYTFHDLLRAYASEQAHLIDTDDQRHAAIHRTLDHYLHTAHIAARWLAPFHDPVPLIPRHQSGVTPENPAGHRQALAWFTAEHAVLLAAVDHAASTGWDTHTWQLAWTLTLFLDRRGHWQDDVTIQQAALAALQRLADPSRQARAHHYLGRAYAQAARFDDAYPHLQHALDLHRQSGDQVGRAYTHRVLGFADDRQGRHTEALAHARQALELFRAVGDRHGQAATLNQVGLGHARLGDHHQALTFCQQALTLLEELGDRRAQANTSYSLGYAHHHLGHYTRAITCYQHAIDISQDFGDRRREAITFAHLGDTHYAIGNPGRARHAWQAALTIFDQLDHPDAKRVAIKLHHLDHGPTAASNTSHNTDAKRLD
jgi:DNA-binding SARP family transcriptional activator/tetratricopeptide (TPR) repeat protein